MAENLDLMRKVGDFFVGTMVFVNVRAIMNSMLLGLRQGAFVKRSLLAIAQELHKIVLNSSWGDLKSGRWKRLD